MVRKHIVQLEDDMDGGPADETVEFGLDGSRYEIDLSGQNAEKLRDAFALYIAHGRRATSRAARPVVARKPGRVTRADREQTQAIRAWARANGHQIGDKGRIPGNILEAYDAQH